MKEQILSYLPAGYPPEKLLYYATIGSTNTEAKKLAQAGAAAETVLFADCQSAGRGRLGRSFLSPAGDGIYLSMILRPNRSARELMHLTCAAATAVCDATEEVLSFRPRIKWINDLVAGNKKLAGILTELSFDSLGNVEWAVVGIGFNCNQSGFPKELENIACSAAMVTGRTVNRAKLAAAIIQHLTDMDLSAVDKTMAIYRRDCVTLGKDITVIRGDLRRNGRALDVDCNGGLVVQYDDRETETVSSGEVSVRGLFGYL